MRAFDYARATTESGLSAALERGYQIMAGGIDVVDLLKERTAAPEKLVSIKPLVSSDPKWTAITVVGSDGARIGPAATLAQIAAHAELRALAPVVVQSIENAATPQLRAVATAAGNLCQRPRCWYFRSSEYNCLKKGGSTCFAVEGENRYHALFGGGPCHIVHASNLATGLLAANGKIWTHTQQSSTTASSNPVTGRQRVESSVSFSERVHDAEKFFTASAPGLAAENILEDSEYIVSIQVPSCSKSAYVDFKEKQAFDWPLASAAVAWHGDHWNVALGGVSPTPWRAQTAEKLLADVADVDLDLATRAGEAALNGARPMSQNGWRLQLVKIAVRDALLKACGKEIPA
jgi:xanthine dehydrogenase YagS FAD-binding subunit